MKKITYIIIGIILLALAVLLFLIFYLKKAPIVILNNVNQAEKITEKEKILQNPKLLIPELQLNQKIAPSIIVSSFRYLGFCGFKNQGDSLDAQCLNIYKKYFGLPADYQGPGHFSMKFSFEAALYMIKANDKDKFLKICQEYVTDRISSKNYDTARLEKYYTDCNLLWDNKYYEDKEYCDLNNKDTDSCSAILTDEENKSCSNKINIKEVTFDKLQSTRCQNDIPFRRAGGKDDCYKIKDSTTRLLCLDIYDPNLCNEAQTAFDNLKLPDFIAKYQLTDCCQL